MIPTFDLTPRNKVHGSLRVNGFFWAWLMVDGVGLILGVMRGSAPGEYIYVEREGVGPLTNDGFKVTAREAKIMAETTCNLVKGYRCIQEEMDENPEEKRMREKNNRSLHYFKYKLPVRPDFLDLALTFANWASESGGFTID